MPEKKNCAWKSSIDGWQCPRPVWAAGGPDEQYCLFHSEQMEAKKEQFKKEIRAVNRNKPSELYEKGQKDRCKNCDFRGFHFPDDCSDFMLHEFEAEDTDFIEAQFSGYASFRGAQFSGDAKFEKAQFSRDAVFAIAQFGGEAQFGEAKFSENARFGRVLFGDDVVFEKVQFSSEAGFKEVQFIGNAIFEESQFSGDASFRAATFSGNAWFREAKFSGDAWFNGALFRGDAEFRRALFRGDAWFERARFCSIVTFISACFDVVASFKASEFYSNLVFKWVKFNGSVYFNSSKVNGDLSLKGSLIGNSIFFNRSYVLNIDLSSCRCTNNVIFNRTRLKSCNFENLSYGGRFEFNRIEFENQSIACPTLLDNVILENASFRNTDLSTVAFGESPLGNVVFNRVSFGKATKAVNFWDHPFFCGRPGEAIYEERIARLISNNINSRIIEFDVAEDVYSKLRYVIEEKISGTLSRRMRAGELEMRLHGSSSWLEKILLIGYRFLNGYGLRWFRAFVFWMLCVLAFAFFIYHGQEATYEKFDIDQQQHVIIAKRLDLPEAVWHSFEITFIITDTSLNISNLYVRFIEGAEKALSSFFLLLFLQALGNSVPFLAELLGLVRKIR